MKKLNMKISFLLDYQIMGKIFKNFAKATDVCSTRTTSSGTSNHGAFISTRRGFAAPNADRTRFDGRNMTSVHAEVCAVKMARESRQCLKGPRRVCR